MAVGSSNDSDLFVNSTCFIFFRSLNLFLFFALPALWSSTSHACGGYYHRLEVAQLLSWKVRGVIASQCITAPPDPDGWGLQPNCMWQVARITFYGHIVHITATSQWARWRLKPPASRFCTQPIVRTQIKETSKLRVTDICEANSHHDTKDYAHIWRFVSFCCG